MKFYQMFIAAILLSVALLSAAIITAAAKGYSTFHAAKQHLPVKGQK